MDGTVIAGIIEHTVSAMNLVLSYTFDPSSFPTLNNSSEEPVGKFSVAHLKMIDSAVFLQGCTPPALGNTTDNITISTIVTAVRNARVTQSLTEWPRIFLCGPSSNVLFSIQSTKSSPTWLDEKKLTMDPDEFFSDSLNDKETTEPLSPGRNEVSEEGTQNYTAQALTTEGHYESVHGEGTLESDSTLRNTENAQYVTNTELCSNVLCRDDLEDAEKAQLPLFGEDDEYPDSLEEIAKEKKNVEVCAVGSVCPPPVVCSSVISVCFD